jgi:arginyl-tRNA synthetase
LYTYVRCKSVLEKELNGDSILPIDILFDNKSYLGFNLVNEEHVILQDLLIYSDIVVKAAIEYAPHYLSQYLYKLAQDYSAFYNSCSILSAKDERKTFRLALTRSVMLILEKGLAILGIKVVAKM